MDDEKTIVDAVTLFEAAAKRMDPFGIKPNNSRRPPAELMQEVFRLAETNKGPDHFFVPESYLRNFLSRNGCSEDDIGTYISSLSVGVEE